jgi:PAS domain S-box-containing protein
VIDVNEVIKYSKDLKLLYVEDNEDAREMTTMILEDFFDSIIIAVDGEDGYNKFQENDIDLIITDINMPKLNGLEMAGKIRELDDDVSIVVLSAHNEDSFFIDSIEIGINGYLLKPIDINQFCNLIYRVIQKFKYITQSKSNLYLLQEYQEATNSSSIVSKTNLKGIITFVNDAFCDISGYTKEELIGVNHNIVRHPDNPKQIFKEMWQTIRDEKKIWKGIVRNRAKNGKSYYVDSLVMPILDLKGEILEYISLRNNITDIMNPVKQLNSAIKNFQNPILIYMKLDKYDMLEEFYAHETVETMQEKVTHYLQNKFSELFEFDKIYQLGNGEYALLIDYNRYFSNKETLVQTLKHYQEQIKEEKIELGTIEYDIAILMSLVYEKDMILESAKLGIKRLLRTKKDFIISNDLAAMVQEQAKENMKTVSMIKKAINSSKIVSYFQPIIHNQTQKIAKYESLVRLIDEDNNVISPFFFLETSKKSNYYTQITNIVLEHSFSILKNCNVDISINLSAIDIEQRHTREKILKLLEHNRTHASRVVFELLEDENIKEFEVIKEFIRNVKDFGVKIAIDDFGAGYSNYERLLDYQPDILKIDGCLIRNIETSSYSLSVVKSIVTFAKEQNIQTIAEFIENESIFNIIKELGVDFSQGYYFGKPEPTI